MPKNTAIVILVLAILAAAVVLTNLLPAANPGKTGKTPASSSLTPTPQVTALAYKDSLCGIELNYPDSLNILEGPNGSVIFTGKSDAQNVIVVTCQKDLPRPALAADQTEELTSGSVSATLYHDKNAKEGTPVDKLIFTNPANGLDVYVSGYGADFQKIISNIQLID